MENRSLTAIRGVKAGHWTHDSGTTGVTAVLFDVATRGGVFVPGSAAGSREMSALAPDHIAGAVHGFCLAGGSAFGLAAADGVMEVLEQRGIGFDSGHGRVPIVPAAILFDLHTAVTRPGRAEGRSAALAADSTPLAEGRVGAAAGARVGKASGAPSPGGFGGWADRVGPYTVAAGVAVNAVGSVWDAVRGEFVGGVGGLSSSATVAGDWRGQTTLAIVCTDAPLDRPRCGILAKMACAGLARTLFPAFTPFDGDTVFAASVGAGDNVEAAILLALGDTAARCVGTAIVRAVTTGRR